LRFPLGTVRHVPEVSQFTPGCPQSNVVVWFFDTVGGHEDRPTLNSSMYTRLKAEGSASTSTYDTSTLLVEEKGLPSQ
jgi:hypothetical protein